MPKLTAKNREKKKYITDVAISKIPRVPYKGLTQEQCDFLYGFAKMVLLTAKEENDSNEVAITCSLDHEDPTDEFGISYGSEHEVDVLSDTV